MIDADLIAKLITGFSLQLEYLGGVLHVIFPGGGIEHENLISISSRVDTYDDVSPRNEIFPKRAKSSGANV